MNTNINTSEGYNGIYLERSGESARSLAEKLAQDPEKPLDDQEMLGAYDFEKFICDIEIAEGVTIADSIRQHRPEVSVAPFFFTKAFLDNQIEIEGVELPQFSSTEEVYGWLARTISKKSIPTKSLMDLSRQSTQVYAEATSEALVNGGEVNDDQLDFSPMVVNPDLFISSANHTSQARAALLDIKSQLSNPDNQLDEAKAAITEIYMARVNGQLSENVPIANYLIKQSELISDEELAALATEVIPSGLRSGLANDKARPKLLKRLDYIRNGMGLDEVGHASAVSNELSMLESLNVSEAIFDAQEKEILETTLVDPDEMVNIFTAVLDKAGKLSSEPNTTWSSTRTSRAADGLFQVVKNDSKKTFAVDGRSGAYKVPSEPRSLYDVIVVGGAHELTHINQVEASDKLSEVLQIANLKGRRISMLSEAGANMNQRQVEQELFGTSKPIALTYARAVQAMESGGGIYEATKAFYDEKLQAFPSIDKKKAAKEAADRVLRLQRKGGISSQPLVYAEESIMINELQAASPEVRERAQVITCLDLVDQLRLHKYGLLPQPEAEAIDFMPIVMQELAPYIDAAFKDSQVG